jgi:hypothetical protein
MCADPSNKPTREGSNIYFSFLFHHEQPIEATRGLKKKNFQITGRFNDLFVSIDSYCRYGKHCRFEFNK